MSKEEALFCSEFKAGAQNANESFGCRSALGRYAHLSREPDPAQGREAARAAWHTHGLILIRPEWLPGWADRKQAELLAEQVHGKRRI